MLVVSSALAAEPARPGSSEKAAPTGGKWQLALDTVADGSKAVTATLPADEPVKSGFGETIPTLVLRYRSGRTSAYVVFDTFLGDGTAEVQVQFGRDPVETQRWRISSDSRAVFVPGDALAFVERLKRCDFFSVRVTRGKSPSLTGVFTPAGIDVVVKALISAGVKYTE
jgi:hypothetical protein